MRHEGWEPGCGTPPGPGPQVPPGMPGAKPIIWGAKPIILPLVQI